MIDYREATKFRNIFTFDKKKKKTNQKILYVLLLLLVNFEGRSIQ